jgi:hypothetical protein
MLRVEELFDSEARAKLTRTEQQHDNNNNNT